MIIAAWPTPYPPLQVIARNRVPWQMPQVMAAGWGAPVKLPTLNTACPEDAIEISRDGLTLYYYWSPTVGASFDELLNGTTGTYYAERVGTDPGFFANPRIFDLRKGSPTGACDGELSFTPTGDEVYFHSNRTANTGYQQQPFVDDPMDIYRSTYNRTWSEPELVVTGYVGEPSLLADGSILYFVHVLVDDAGVFGSDIWYAKRAN